MPPSPHPWDLYQKHIFELGYGWPLWQASPESDAQEIDVGSVIYKAVEGRYCQLFNSMQPADHPSNVSKDVPDNYTPFARNNVAMLNLEATINNPCLASKSIEDVNGFFSLGIQDPIAGLAAVGAGVKFLCKDEAGAFLVFDPPNVTKHLQSKRHIVTYMRQHFDSWMYHANDKWGLGVKDTGLYFVSGTVKTSRWFASAFQGEHYRAQQGHIQVDLGSIRGAGPVGSINGSISIANKKLNSPSYNYGPTLYRATSADAGSITSTSSMAVQTVSEPGSRTPEPVSLPRNQCILIHYYKMKKRFLWRSKVMEAAAGPHNLPPGEDQDPQAGEPVRAGDPHSDESSDIEEVPGVSSVPDPVDFLLDYILENSDSQIAIATDRDIIVLFQQTGIPNDLKSAIITLKPPIDVDEDGVGTISVDIRFPEPRTTGAIASSSTVDVGGLSATTARGDAGANPSAGDEQGAAQNDEEGSSEEARIRRRFLNVPAGNGHTGSVTALAVSPDSRWVASGSDDTMVILWNPVDHSLVHRWESHGDNVWHLAFSPDGTRLASAGNEGRVMVWSVPEGDPVVTLEGHSEPVHSVAWAPDGARLASASDDTTARVWDAETWETLFVLEGHHGMITFVRFSYNGRWLATGGADYTARLWYAETGALHKTLEGHKGMIWAAVFDPDDNRIASASDDGSVRIWKVETGEELVILQEHQGPVWAVQFSEDGKQILSGSSDSTVKVCDSYSGEKLLSMRKHESMVNNVSYSPDGRYIASASSDNTVRLWNRLDGSVVAMFNEHNDKVTHVVFSPDGKTLSSGSDDGNVLIRMLDDYIQEMPIAK